MGPLKACSKFRSLPLDGYAVEVPAGTVAGASAAGAIEGAAASAAAAHPCTVTAEKFAVDAIFYLR